MMMINFLFILSIFCWWQKMIACCINRRCDGPCISRAAAKLTIWHICWAVSLAYQDFFLRKHFVQALHLFLLLCEHLSESFSLPADPVAAATLLLQVLITSLLAKLFKFNRCVVYIQPEFSHLCCLKFCSFIFLSSNARKLYLRVSWSWGMRCRGGVEDSQGYDLDWR